MDVLIFNCIRNFDDVVFDVVVWMMMVDFILGVDDCKVSGIGFFGEEVILIVVFFVLIELFEFKIID